MDIEKIKLEDAYLLSSYVIQMKDPTQDVLSFSVMQASDYDPQKAKSNTIYFLTD